MEHETRTKVGSMIVGLALVGTLMVGMAPPVQAEEPTTVGGEGAGSCITVYHDPIDVAVSPRDCMPEINETGPDPGP